MPEFQMTRAEIEAQFGNKRFSRAYEALQKQLAATDQATTANVAATDRLNEAAFVTLSANAELPNERVLQFEPTITAAITDTSITLGVSTLVATRQWVLDQGYSTGGGGGGVTDGDKGDITVSGTGAVWTIDNGAVSLAKMANLAANSIIGNNTGAGATPIALTAAQVRTLINVADGATANLGTVTSVGGTGTVNGLTLTGSVTSSGNLTLGGTLTISGADFGSQAQNRFLASPNGAAGNPTFRKIVLADLPTQADLTFLGNNTGAVASPVVLTTAQATALLDVATTALKGLAPASGGGTTNFLRADLTWAAPPSGSGGSVGASYATGAPGVIAVAGTTSGTPGTGAFIPSAAVSGFRAWSTVFTGWTGLVRFDDGSAWELSFCYWDGTTLSRSSTQRFDSSSGSPLSLTSAATATLISDIVQFLDSSFAGPVRGTVMRSNSATVDDVGFAWTNVQSPTAAGISNANYLNEQYRVLFTSATTANAGAGRSPSQRFMTVNSTAGRGGGMMSVKWGFTQVPAAHRVFIGGSDIIGLTGATEPSALVGNNVICGKDSTDTNLQFIVNNNSGAGTKTNTGIALAVNGWYHYAMWCYPGSLEWHQLLVREDTGAIYYRKTSTDVPVTGAGLLPNLLSYLTATTGTAVVLNQGEVKLKAGR